MLNLIRSYPLAPEIPAPSEADLDDISDQYEELMYQAMLLCAKQTLIQLKNRVFSRSSVGFLFLERPFFEVEVKLAVPSVTLSPSPTDIQAAVNRTALTVLRAFRTIPMWSQANNASADFLSFFERIGKDLEVVKTVLLLTGAFQGTRTSINEYLRGFKEFDWLWKEDMDLAYQKFIENDPTIADFDVELRRLVGVQERIDKLRSFHIIGALSLNTSPLKKALTHECKQWKIRYSDQLHVSARNMMNDLLNYISNTMKRLGREVDSLDSLRAVMAVLAEVRERESAIETEINPILDMYHMIETYLPGASIDQEELDQRSVLRAQWARLSDYADNVAEALNRIQGTYKKQLTRDVRAYMDEVKTFRKKFELSGPLEPGLPPSEAMERLARFQASYEILWRKYEAFEAGEELFALPKTEYPELVRTRKDLEMCTSLYGLYKEVIDTLDDYRSMPWSSVVESLNSMGERIAAFDNRCKRLPKAVKTWSAYKELRGKISSFLDVSVH